jgi:uncharacterized protein (UPF0332 family)
MNPEKPVMWEIALEKRSAALLLQNSGYFGDSLSRCYYAAFHAVTYLFSLSEQTFSSHQQLKGAFHKQFIHTGLLEKSLGVGFEYLFECRQSGDYDITIRFDALECRKGLLVLQDLLTAIRVFILQKYSKNLELPLVGEDCG